MHIGKLLNKGTGYIFFLALACSVCTVFMTRMQFAGLGGTIEENYFNAFGLSSVILFFFCIPLFYIIISLIDSVLYKCISQISFEGNRENTAKILKFWGSVITLSWLPYYLSYYPGGVYSDTLNSIKYSVEGILSNRHPFLYNVLIGFAVKSGQILGKDLTWSMGLFLAIQMIVLEVEIIYFLYWMLTRRINRSLRILIMIFLVFYPLIPLYSIAIWKDTPFCMAVLLWMIFLTDLYLCIQKNELNYKILFKYIVAMFLVAFTRNNGIYVVVFSTAVFLITTFKISFAKKKMTYCWMVFALIAIIIIQGPIYRRVGIVPPVAAESFGIPLQQIGAVVAYDGNITESQKEAIENFLPYDEIKEQYKPGFVDSMKWSEHFNNSYLSEHKADFLKLWLRLFFQNPKIYVKAYLLATAGFWNVDVSSYYAYVHTNVATNAEYVMSQTDYFEKWFGFSFQHFVNPRHYISCAWLFWIFFVCMFFSMMHGGGWRKCYLFTPQMGIWLTLMIATPVASSLRYVAALLYTLPFVVIIPILLERERQERRQTK